MPAVIGAALGWGLLALLADDGNELARERTDESAPKVAEAFTRHGYPWQDIDPRANTVQP